MKKIEIFLRKVWFFLRIKFFGPYYFLTLNGDEEFDEVGPPIEVEVGKNELEFFKISLFLTKLVIIDGVRADSFLTLKTRSENFEKFFIVIQPCRLK